MWKISARRCAMSCGMSFILMYLHYKMVLLWIMDANKIFSLMQNVPMGAEFASMVKLCEMHKRRIQ